MLSAFLHTCTSFILHKFYIFTHTKFNQKHKLTRKDFYMTQLWKYLVLFGIGGTCYLLIEILYRGHTHWTMGILGGICFIFIGLINNVLGFQTSLLLQMLISAVIITVLEFLSGLLLNVYLGLNIWDYSHLPFNIMGQVCLPFFVIWFFLSPLAIFADDFIRWKFFHESKPHYHF